jgi:hypothetical protein
MSYTQAGWILALAAIGMLCGLIGVEITELSTWEDMATVGFVGKSLIHVASVISAFVGGKLLPQPQRTP